MAMTLEQVRSQLQAIEPDEQTFAGIGAAEIPSLATLLGDAEAWMAARAVYALSRIGDAAATALMQGAAGDPREPVRAAVAASAGNLDPGYADDLLLKLLADPEPSIRKFAIQSVSAGNSGAVQARLQAIAADDPAPILRDMAGEQRRGAARE